MGVTLVRLAVAFLSVICRPVVFFQDRVARPPSWWWAAGGPAVCTCLILWSQVLFLSRTAPPLTAALTGAGVPAAFIVSSQYMGLASTASTCLVMWLVASAVTIACDVLFVGTDDVPRVLEVSGLAFYSQIPWLLAVVVVAWYYQPPFPQMGHAGMTAVEPGRLLRLLREDETRLVIRTVNEGSTLWLHGLFGAGYHAVSRTPLPRCLLLASAIYGLPHLVGVLM
jgi:hypothetical protein